MIDRLLSIKNHNILFLLITILYILPITLIPILFDGIGVLDWEHFEQRLMTIAITVKDYMQFPGNNPWVGGGTPIAYSTYGTFSILSMIFGGFIGLRIGIALYFLIGLIGCLKLSDYFKLDKESKVFFTFYFLFSNSLAWHLFAGHLIFINILSLPMLILLLLNFDKNNYNGYLFGILYGIVFLDGALYTGQYFAIFFSGVFIYLLFKTKKHQWIYFVISAALTFAFITNYYILSLLSFMRDYPRIVDPGLIHHNLLDTLKFALTPYIKFYGNVTAGGLCSNVHENANFIGLSVVAMFIYLISQKKYIFLVPIIFLICAYSGDSNIWQFNYILKKIPSFSSHLCTGRIRLFTPLIIGGFLIYAYKSGALKTIRFGRFSIEKKHIFTIAILEVFIASSIVLYQSHKYQVTRINIDQEKYDFFNLQNPSHVIDGVTISNLTQLTKLNIGVIATGDSNLPLNKLSLGADQSSYTFEYHQNNKEIKPIYWSPNKIIFKSTTQECIQTNIPYSSGWSINGNIIQNNNKIINFEKLICANPDKNGLVVLQWKNPNLSTSLKITLLLGIIIILIITIRKRALYMKV
jgi:MFS family permease